MTDHNKNLTNKVGNQLLLWNRNDLLRFQFLLSSGSRQYLAQYLKNIKIIQNLAFSMSETAIFISQKVAMSLLIFFPFFIPFYVGSGS